MSSLLFFLAAIGVITGAVGVVVLRNPFYSVLALVGHLLSLAVLFLLLRAEAVDGYGAGYSPGPRSYGTPAYIGKLLLTRFLLAFEIASFLLLIAAVGGVVLARRRGGLGEQDEREALTPLDLIRPRATGTT